MIRSTHTDYCEILNHTGMVFLGTRRELKAMAQELGERFGNNTSTVHDFGDGTRIVKLEADTDKKYEGHMMNNCLKELHGDETNLYSLRDDDNIPLMSFRMDGPSVWEMQGRVNSAPKVEHQQKLLEHMSNTYDEFKWAGVMRDDQEQRKFLQKSVTSAQAKDYLGMMSGFAPQHPTSMYLTVPHFDYQGFNSDSITDVDHDHIVQRVLHHGLHAMTESGQPVRWPMDREPSIKAGQGFVNDPGQDYGSSVWRLNDPKAIREHWKPKIGGARGDFINDVINLKAPDDMVRYDLRGNRRIRPENLSLVHGPKDIPSDNIYANIPMFITPEVEEAGQGDPRFQQLPPKHAIRDAIKGEMGLPGLPGIEFSDKPSPKPRYDTYKIDIRSDDALSRVTFDWKGRFDKDHPSYKAEGDYEPTDFNIGAEKDQTVPADYLELIHADPDEDWKRENE